MSKNAIIYARVSSPKQSIQWDSLRNQIDEMRRHCKFKWWNILFEFQEQCTGTKEDRPEIINALEKIKEFKKQWIKIDYFLITKIDRNTRWWIDVHYNIKRRLQDLWVELRDVQWIIQESRNIVDIEWINTDWYDWAVINPSETQENFFAMSSKEERASILRRTIWQEIKISLEWYWVRPSVFWYMNKAIFTDEHKRRTIQIPDPKESIWVKKMYEMKAQWYSDNVIVEEINKMWFISRSMNIWDKSKTKILWNRWSKPLDIKKMQAFIANPIYAGVCKVTWRGNESKIVRQKYSWLVSIDLWNKANKWKKKIIIRDNEVKITKWDEENTQHTKVRRIRDNPDFPFWRLVYGDWSDIFFTYNSPKGYNGTRYHYYSAKGHPKNIPVDEFEKTIADFFQDISFEPELLKLQEAIMRSTYNIRKAQFDRDIDVLKERVIELGNKERNIIENLDKFIEFKDFLEAKHNEIKEIKKQKIEIEWSIKSIENDIDIDTLVEFWNMVSENLGNIASGLRQHDILQFIFDFSLGYTPQYSDILIRNIKLQPLLALGTKKRTIDDSYSWINNNFKYGWQLRSGSNWGQRLWRPLHLPLCYGAKYMSHKGLI